MKLSVRTRREERRLSKGATAVEYAIMVALIAVVVISAVRVLGNKASASFSTTAAQMPS